MVNCFDAMPPPSSVAVTVKVAEPVAVGVPLMTPVLASSAKPAGRLPSVTLHVIAPLFEDVAARETD